MSTTAKYVEVYAKQVDVAREFGVTEATVHNWIKSAEAGNNNLHIRKSGGKKFILKDAHNIAEMMRLKERGRKHASNLNEMITHVHEEELQEMIGAKNMVMLYNILSLHNHVPMKFSYLGDGAGYWDDYYQQTNFGERDVESLEKVYKVLYGYLERYDKVNVIDLGCGNGSTVIDFVKKLEDHNKFNTYVAADISKKMKNLAVKNIASEIPNLKYKKWDIDFETESLQEVLYELKYEDTEANSVNLIFLLGSTLGNAGSLESQIRIIQNIKDGMSPNDLLFVGTTFDAEYNRTTFSETLRNSEDNLFLNIIHKLGIESYMYKKEFKYDTETHIKECNLVLNYRTKVIFKNLDKEIVFEAGEKINVFRLKLDSFDFVSKKMSKADMELKYIYRHDNKPAIYYLSSVKNTNF